MRVGIKSAINYHRKNISEINKNVKQLTKDIRNCPYHTFGRHSNCAQYFCTRDQSDVEYVSEMEECGLMDDIISAGNRLVQNSHSLLLNMTNNAAETYNSIVAKFVGGKRINFAVKGGYGVRCNAAAVSFNKKGNYIPTPYKRLSKSVPGIHTQRFITQMKQRRYTRKTRGPQLKKRTIVAPKDKDYGLLCEDDDNDDDDASLEKRKQQFLDNLPKPINFSEIE